MLTTQANILTTLSNYRWRGHCPRKWQTPASDRTPRMSTSRDRNSLKVIIHNCFVSTLHTTVTYYFVHGFKANYSRYLIYCYWILMYWCLFRFWETQTKTDQQQQQRYWRDQRSQGYFEVAQPRQGSDQHWRSEASSAEQKQSQREARAQERGGEAAAQCTQVHSITGFVAGEAGLRAPEDGLGEQLRQRGSSGHWGQESQRPGRPQPGQRQQLPGQLRPQLQHGVAPVRQVHHPHPHQQQQ